MDFNKGQQVMINYKSLKDHVYEYLYKQINTGKLKPKEKISENKLCEHLNVSRTPVREALIMLEEKGYVTRLPRRGFIVREITSNKIKEIYSIIGCLEGMAASLAIKNINDEDLSLMKKLVNKMNDSIEKRNIYEYFKLQRKFHNVFLVASENSELINIVTSLKKRFIKKAYYNHETDDHLFKDLSNFNKGHERIVQLFKKGNSEEIEKYIKNEHWSLKHVNTVVSPFEANKNSM
jgi:DNA-binding GntR family transcriptional regulator